jgi:hypothetical protein
MVPARGRSDDAPSFTVAGALGETGVRDERILYVLLTTLDRSDVLGAFEVDPASPIRNINAHGLEDPVQLLGEAAASSVRGACDHLNGWTAASARRGSSDRHSR